MAFRSPDHLIVKETEHWIVNHRIESKLPGYLMVVAKQETTHLFDLPVAAQTEIGPLLAVVQKAVTELLKPEQLYIGRYGHMTGHSIHFHVIPICAWVKDAFAADERYRALRSFYTPGVYTSDPDGGELTVYVWREFCESKNPPRVFGPSVEEVVHLLRKTLS